MFLDYIKNYFRGETIFSIFEFRISRSWHNRLIGALALTSLLCGLGTYFVLTDTYSFGAYRHSVFALLNLNFVILLLLFVLIASRLVGVWSGRKRGLAGSHLHVRLVYIFSLLAAVPAIVMTVFSVFLFHFGIQAWFSERVRTAIEKSQSVAAAYLDEHKQVIRADVLAMANDLNRQSSFLIQNKNAFEEIIKTQSFLRNFSESVVFELSGGVIARSGSAFSLQFQNIPGQALAIADGGEVVVITGGNDDRVRALVKLESLENTYLFVGRLVDPEVLSYVKSTREASEDYKNLQSRYSQLQIIMTLTFVVVGLLMLLMAIWLGLLLARQLITPISSLVQTADRVRAGDFSARVPEQKTVQEFDYLARSFNRMTLQIEEQQRDLIEANRQLDHRRRFTETVLEGVSSGILGLSASGVIDLANNSALTLLDRKSDELTGRHLHDLLPEVESLLLKAYDRPENLVQGEVIIKKNGQKRTLLVRIGIEHMEDKEAGAVITFDDITELQAAQKKAAWSDVARRIAHEIKNPLTPIQLSAERLKRRYIDQILKDSDIFVQCTDTIVKHVEDIERMVNEFSSFARMPDPVMQLVFLPEQVENALVLQEQAHPDIQFTFDVLVSEKEQTECDPRQFRQAITNILQNAIDSVHAADNQKLCIDVVVGSYHNSLFVLVNDNGFGFSETDNLLNLMEPYVTHKEKGTGLGLAIVKKIMDDHAGQLILGVPGWLKDFDSSYPRYDGATVLLLFPSASETKNLIKG